ncbi:uncharacterized protein LOC129702978 [Leucoraja erinacea]|uniref:uncharacterized protein LOC129702978 n=1 Tax=Leucoraja erinaceus TaxID=7782 RepID=UPI0024565C4E|nr:uncharacterized protein LOC129702978 [Leucoraja erinacea]
MRYYLGWMKLKLNASENAINHSNCNYLDQFWNSGDWLTEALNVSAANVHILCPNPAFGITQYPILHFIFGLNQNNSLEGFHQASQNFTDTNEFVCGIEIGESILHPCNEENNISMRFKRQRTWSSNAVPEDIQNTVSFQNITSELTLAPSEHSRENPSLTSTLAYNGTIDPARDTQSASQLENMRETTVPTESPEWQARATDTTAFNSTEATFIAFRSSISIINWTVCHDFINKTSFNYRKLENILLTQLPQLLTEAAERVLYRALEFTVVVEEFRKDSLIIDLVFLTHFVENATLANMNSVLMSALNQLQRSQKCLFRLSGTLEDFLPCEKSICAYNCNAIDGMYKCSCLNVLNGDRFRCTPNDTSSCGGTQVVIPGPLALDLEKMVQLLNFANSTGCSFSRSRAGTDGILHVRDLCMSITDNVTDLWMEWKNIEILHLVLEGPNIAVCQFSVFPKEQMIFKLIDSKDQFKGYFLADHTQLHEEQFPASEKRENLKGTLMDHQTSLAAYTNESPNVTMSIRTRLANNSLLFVKSYEVVSVSQESERVKLIENGCPTVNGLSGFLNGNSTFTLLSVNSSVTKNFTFLRCELQICAESHCGCSRNLGKNFVPSSDSLQEDNSENGPNIISDKVAEDESKKDDPSMMAVMLITIGVILLVVVIIGFLRFIYRRISDATYADRVLKKQGVLRRESSTDPVTLMSWKQL